jgi:RING-box protein 1
MADVEMKEATAGASAKGKGVSKGSEGASDGKKKFEVKKWNAVALWAWDIVVDNCAICRNHIMDLCIECQANQGSSTTEECTVAWGICNVGFALATAFLHLGLTNVLPLSMHSTSTAYLAGSKPDKFVRWITETGNSRSTAGRLKIREFTQVSVCDCSF